VRFRGFSTLPATDRRTDVLEYKGYTGRVEFDNEAEVFYGEVCGLRDVITFQGSSAQEVKTAFRDSIDDYLEYCEELGQEPDKPFSGRLLVRMPPDLHRKLHNSALALEKSLNSLIVEALEKRAST
jgi:predicted HicB family RNase H-like nuclease